MGRRYEKFILSKGFAIIEEKEIASSGWLPTITFFNEYGNKLFSLCDQDHIILFNELVKNDNALAQIENKEIFEFVVSPKGYSLVRFERQLQIFLHAYTKDHKRDDVLKIVISRDEGSKLLKAMQTLA